MISSGQVNFDGFSIHWEFFTREIALITNGDGDFIISSPWDVLEIDLDVFGIKPYWKETRELQAKHSDDELGMEIYKDSTLMAKLEKRMHK